MNYQIIFRTREVRERKGDWEEKKRGMVKHGSEGKGEKREPKEMKEKGQRGERKNKGKGRKAKQREGLKRAAQQTVLKGLILLCQRNPVMIFSSSNSPLQRKWE